MFRNFWNTLLGRENTTSMNIKFSKDHSLTQRAINVLRSAGVPEDSNWPLMVDKVTIALAAYAKLDQLSSQPLNAEQLKTVNPKTAIKKTMTVKEINEPKTAENTNGEVAKTVKIKALKKTQKTKTSTESTAKLDKKSVDPVTK